MAELEEQRFRKADTSSQIFSELPEHQSAVNGAPACKTKVGDSQGSAWQWPRKSPLAVPFGLPAVWGQAVIIMALASLWPSKSCARTGDARYLWVPYLQIC